MKRIILFCFIVTLFFSCEKSRPQSDCKTACGTDLPCTYIFASIVVQLTDGSGNPVVPDELVVTRKRDNKVILNGSGTTIPQPGRYVLFSDAQLRETSRCGEEFELTARKNDRLIAKRTYTIAHDCCHINLLSGDTKIVVTDN